MEKRRLRATILFRIVILVICLSLFAVAAIFSKSVPWTVGSVIFLSLVWVIGIEGGLLLHWIENRMIDKVQQSDKPINSIWFTDLDVLKKKNKDS
ncbi:MAG: hypothetical protein RL095_3223 [Verrucomicrobiota bacterium]|jgi:cellobiose-specific phosphotransferase system component IIC